MLTILMLGPALVARKRVVSINVEKKLLCGECRFFMGPRLKLSKLE